MKSIKKIGLYYLFTAFAILAVFTGCQSKKSPVKGKSDVYYTCSMHPQVHEDHSGDCPICGMKLIKVGKQQESNSADLDSLIHLLAQPVNQIATGSFKVITPGLGSQGDTVSVEGVIDFDRSNTNTVASRVAGRIEQLFVTYVGQPIHVGQPLAKIYSPELLSTQRNLLQSIQNKDKELSDALEAKLVNLGMYKKEIQKVIRDKTPLAAFTVYSPYDGVALQANGTAGIQDSFVALQLKEGAYVTAGQTLYSVQNMNQKWAVLQIFPAAINKVHKGDPILISADATPQKAVSAKIDFIPPYREQQKSTTGVRAYIKDMPAGWKIGTLIHGKIISHNDNQELYVPLTAVNRLGKQNVVWVRDHKYPQIYHARLVTVGAQTEDSIAILSGINPGEEIVENVAYMVGSDSFFQ